MIVNNYTHKSEPLSLPSNLILAVIKLAIDHKSICLAAKMYVFDIEKQVT